MLFRSTDATGPGSGAVVEAVIATGQVKTFLRPDKSKTDLQETQLVSPFSSDAREFGYSVDIGTLNAAVGAPGTYNESGGVLIVTTLGAQWVSNQMIYPYELTLLGNVRPRFGHSVSMSRDENWI